MKMALPLDGFIESHFFQPKPVALVTTISAEGVPNVAPKTQVTPVGRRNYWAFGCCSGHHTYQNVVEQGEFVVNIPSPELIEYVSGSAAEVPPGADEIAAAGLTAIPSQAVRVPSIAECGVHIECRRHQIVDGLGDDGLIIGRVVAAMVDSELLNTDPAILGEHPLLIYVHPNHYGVVESARRFTFPENYKA